VANAGGDPGRARFAKEWVLENMVGRPVFNSMTKMDAEHPGETVDKELQSMMPWLKNEHWTWKAQWGDFLKTPYTRLFIA
jgi:ketol-acid reductoisomerase